MRQVNAYLSTIIGVATGGDTGALGKFKALTGDGNPPERKEVNELLYEMGIPQAEVLKADLKRAYSECPPKYFASARKLAAKFRTVRGIISPSDHPETDTGPTSASEMAEGVMDLLNSEEPADSYNLRELACPNERSDFYESEQWKRRSKAVRAMDQFKCRNCGRSHVELHVHHVQPIYSSYSKKFERNFQVLRLKTLCKKCHKNYHKKSVRNTQGFEYATKRQKNEEVREDRRRKRTHDRKRECRYCREFVWND
jgi:5-methylcytosine-specific restriction endonuclease McrA